MTADVVALEPHDNGRLRFAVPPSGHGSASSLSRSVHSADLRKGPTVADDILTLSDATFDETIAGSDTPVLVDFWAEWCGPCKMIAPTLAEIASEQKGKIAIGKLNVDDNPDTARRFDVMSIPTLLVFKDGQQVKRLVGAKGKGQLLQDLAEFIG
jgi:thioredoxin 1